MRAQILRNIKPPEGCPTGTWRSDSLGDIEPLSPDPSFPAVKTLEQVAQESKLTLRDSAFYDMRSVMTIAGSVGRHEDPRLGLVLNWILEVKNLPGYEDSSWKPAQLIAGGKALDLREGDIFIFNADRPHAWVSNSVCTLLQIMVAKKRVRKSTALPRVNVKDIPR